MSDAWRYAVWPIQDQDQGHEPLNVVNPAIFKSYLPRHLQWELATYHGFLKDTISQFDHMGLINFESILTCYDVSELVNSRLLLCSFLFFGRIRSEGRQHHGHTFSIYLCPLSFWLLSFWCCPSRLCVVFLVCITLHGFDGGRQYSRCERRRVTGWLRLFPHFRCHNVIGRVSNCPRACAWHSRRWDNCRRAVRNGDISGWYLRANVTPYVNAAQASWRLSCLDRKIRHRKMTSVIHE